MSETRILTGHPEQVITAAKLINGGLEVVQGEISHFTDGDPSEEFWTRQHRREPHPDLLQCFRDLAPHALEICCIDEKKAKEFQVVGFSVKNWADDTKATVHLQSKYKAQDGAWIPLSSPNILIENTAYKNKQSLNAAIVTLIEECMLYVHANKCEAPWSLFDVQKSQPKKEQPEAAGSKAS